MSALLFERREVPVLEGDTVASSLYRAGVRTFTRSLKYHRRRSLYCGTGECPNCLVTVDGVPGVRSCVTPARDGMRVERAHGWPSTERDLLHVTDSLHRLMPVGFYYKTFIRPRFAWPLAERVIRRATGLGRLPEETDPRTPTARHLRTEVLVVGAGTAGLTAALEAARSGERVVVCDEAPIGSRLAPGPTLDRVRVLEAQVRVLAEVQVLDRHAALGLYEGASVPLAAQDELVQVRAERIFLATGATETHPVFPGNDLPGTWLGRAASKMVALHHVPIGERVVVAASTDEGMEHLSALVGAGANIVAAVVPSSLHDEVPDGVETIVDGRVTSAQGRRQVAAVFVASSGGTRRISCDALVLCLGLAPRDALARMAVDETVEVVGDAALGEREPHMHEDGMLCLCEDVSLHDLRQAWDEGYRSSEILKRYTTATMGPCQGAMCGGALACVVRDLADASGMPASHQGARTTARPPARPVPLETLAAAVHEVIEKRTSLHEVHEAAGGRLDWSGGWKRPFGYGDRREEYRAVRERVSLMDVGTLGKFLVAGRDASTLVDRMFPTRIGDLEPGRSRYVLALDEAGYVLDDGLLCALDDGGFYLTSTSGGAARMDARLREWADLLGLHVHVLDRTAELGAVNLAGPLAREVLEPLCNDPLDADAFPYPGHREIAVAGVPCRAIRTGFVGELAFELHHPRSRGPELWAALMREGQACDILPHGLDALELLRLEKGHLYLGQDTMPDDTPAKLGLSRAVDMGKEWFVGKPALERMASLPASRRLVGLGFDGGPEETAELRGMPITLDGAVVGRVTSAERSIALDRAIGLGWIRSTGDGLPTELRAGTAAARVAPTPFYDPEGVRVRG
jgi:sarcosine oxidase subunit alpha